MRAEELCLPLLFAPEHMTVHQWRIRELIRPPPPASTHHPLKVPVLLSPENGLFRLQGPLLELATGILAFHQRAWVKRQLCPCKSQGKVALCISCVVLRYMFRRLPVHSTHHCVNEVIQAVGKFFCLFFFCPVYEESTGLILAAGRELSLVAQRYQRVDTLVPG